MRSRRRRRAGLRFSFKRDRFFRGAVLLLVGLGIVFYTLSWLEKSVALEADGKVVTYHSFKHTVAEALAEKGIKLRPKDAVTPGLGTRLKDGLKIKVTRAIRVTVLVDGKQLQLLTLPKTVGGIIAEAGIALNPLDRVSMPLSKIAGPGSEVRVVRVTEKVLTNIRSLAFRSEGRKDLTLEKGIRRIVRRGKLGQEQVIVKVTYEDGKKTRTQVLSRKLLREPRDELVAYGTITSVSRGGHLIHFSEAILAKATAYTYTGHNTYSGTRPTVGVVAVDPAVIKLGSRLYVEGYGYARAMDIGRAIKGPIVDLFFETEKECRQWGKRQVKVYVMR